MQLVPSQDEFSPRGHLPRICELRPRVESDDFVALARLRGRQTESSCGSGSRGGAAAVSTSDGRNLGSAGGGVQWATLVQPAVSCDLCSVSARRGDIDRDNEIIDPPFSRAAQDRAFTIRHWMMDIGDRSLTSRATCDRVISAFLCFFARCGKPSRDLSLTGWASGACCCKTTPELHLNYIRTASERHPSRVPIAGGAFGGGVVWGRRTGRDRRRIVPGPVKRRPHG